MDLKEKLGETSKDHPTVEFRKKSQITIPKSIVERFNLSEGDKLEFIPEDDGFKIIPVVQIPKSQMWFWSDKWQEGERAADQDIKTGRVSKEYDDLDELMEDLFDEDYEV